MSPHFGGRPARTITVTTIRLSFLDAAMIEGGGQRAVSCWSETIRDDLGGRVPEFAKRNHHRRSWASPPRPVLVAADVIPE